jgi:hypothetical protein
MPSEVWPAVVSASAAIVSGFGGVFIGDRLRARGESQKWDRELSERRRQERLDLYAEILEAARETDLALDFHRIVVTEKTSVNA